MFDGERPRGRAALTAERGMGDMAGHSLLRDIPLGRNRDCVPEPVFFSPSPKSDYTVSAIKIVQFCM